MPGTIQVSVLEFKSSSSLSASSSISLNVSLGKKEYQTLDKGDFHFPLTTLRDNLVVTLYDADGNKLAHTGVRTMSIVEKGSWDDIFPFEEGGHVHMKLQFSLSEEDRNRIRTMRETAMKKKTPGTNLSFTDKSDRASPAPKETEVPTPEANQRELVELHETPVPPANIYSKPVSVEEVLTEKEMKSSEFSYKKNSVIPKLDNGSVGKSKRSESLGKTPSTVRKMISAFESNVDQDARSPKKAPILKSLHNKFKDVSTPAETNSKGLESPFLMRNPQESKRLASRPSENIHPKQDFVGIEPSLPRKKLIDSRSKVTKSEGKDINTKRIFSAENEVINTKKGVKLPHDMMNLSTSTKQSNSVACSEEEHRTFGSLGMWIFPNNTRPLCVTTAGKEVIDLLGQNEAKTHLEADDGSLPAKVKRPQGSFWRLPDKKRIDKNSKSGSCPDDANGGLVGQVIKIAVIVGFGVLVLLTRQREPRKRSKAAKDDFYSTQDFMDEQHDIN